MADDPTNAERAASAQAALESVEKYLPLDEDSISDLIADLLHLARANYENPKQLLAVALANYQVEVMAEERGVR